MSHSLRIRFFLLLLLGALASSGYAQCIFNFTTATMSVDESGATFSVTIQRSGDTIPSSSVTVSFGAPTNPPTGTTAATAGDDYGVGINSPTTFIFPPDDELETFTFTVKDDDLLEGPEQFEFNLRAASANAVIGTRGRLVVTIQDQESNPGTLSFTSNKASVVAGKSTSLTVQRAGGSFGQVTVNYDFSKAGYTAGTLTFLQGETSKTIQVNAPNSAATSPSDVIVTLSSPTGGATLGQLTSLTLTVNPSDVFTSQAAGFTGLLDLGTGYGNITLKTTATGSVTGKLLVDGTAYTIKGKLNADGTYTQTFTSKVNGTAVSKKLDLQLGTLAFKGTFDPDANAAGAVRNITGERDAIVAKGASAPHTGYFTLFLGNNSLQSTGYTAPGTLTVSKTGSATLKVTLPDGTKASGATKISGTGEVRFSLPLYAKLGFLQVTATGAASTPDGFDGMSTWTKPAVVKPKAGQLYTGGVASSQATLIGDIYVKPAAKTVVLASLATNGGAAQLAFSGGNLSNLSHSVTVSSANKVALADGSDGSDKIKITINAATGTFTGSFLDTGKKPHKITGVVLQGEQEFRGQFNGITIAGKVVLTPVNNG